MSETRQLRALPAELSVCIGLPTGPYLPWQTTLALADTVRICTMKGIPINVACIAGASIVTEARNRVVKTFLDQPEYSRLFWIDSDMVWRTDDFLRMLVLSSEMPVICGAYPRKKPDGRMTITPPDGEEKHNEFGCRTIGGTGLGFSCMQRGVVEALAAKAELYFDETLDEELPDVFRIDTVSRPKHRRTRRGEDMAFFADIRALGYDVWLDPSVKLGHAGLHVFESPSAP